MGNRDRNYQDDSSSFGEAIRDEANEVGIAAVRRISDAIQQRIVYQKGLNLVAVIPADHGFIGGRIVVPPDEVHVVTGAGKTIVNLSQGYKVYGQAYMDAIKKAGKDATAVETVYWRNARTVIRALKTTAFTVTLENMEVLDSGYVKYYADVHMIAELDATEPLIAASKIGSMEELLGNIEQVAASELTTAAAKFALIQVIKDRSILGNATEEGVKTALKAIGYTLNTLRIGELRGEAVEKLVQQSTAVVTKDATIEINKNELITLDDNRARERREAELKATTDQATTAQRLTAEQANEIAATDKEEQVKARQHTLTLANVTREQETAVSENELALKKVTLQQSEDLAQAKSQAATALETQSLAKTRELEGAKADADRLDLVQKRDLARATERTEQEAARLLSEKTAEVQRTVKVRTAEAEGEAQALRIRTGAATETQLQEAKAKAQATEIEAQAEIKGAEATRATAAAQGLAAADVRERELKNEAAQVEVTKAQGMAQAAVAKEQADAKIHEAEGLLKVEMDRLTQTAALLTEHPEMMHLEILKINNAQALALRQSELNAQVQMVTAMAAHMDLRVNLIGDGSRASQIMASVMQIATGAQVVGQEVPMVGSLLGTNGHSNGSTDGMLGKIQLLIPSIKKCLAGINPTMYSTLTVKDLVDALGPVVSGDKTLADALAGIKEHTQFNMFTNMNIGALLPFLGLSEKTNGAVEVAK